MAIPTININVGRRCVICGEKGALESGLCLDDVRAFQETFNVPDGHDFSENFTEYLKAPELEVIAKQIIKVHGEELPHLEAADIAYFWKEKGGKKGGKLTLGKTELPKGLLQHYSGQNFIIWLAADNCQGFSKYQIIALMFHELKHVDWNSETGEYQLRGHDFEGFYSEIALFGEWLPDVTGLKRAFETHKNPGLFDAEPAEDDSENHASH